MDPMLEIARRFLAVEITFERNAWVNINSQIEEAIEEIDKKKKDEKKFNDPLQLSLWKTRDVRAEEVLANVFYMKPEIAHDLCQLKPELCPDFIHYLVDEARREWHVEKNMLGWPPKQEVHNLLTEHHYEVSEQFPEALELSLIKDPKFMLALADHLKAALPFSLVLHKELEEIRRSRRLRLHEDADAKAAREWEEIRRIYSILERLPADDSRRGEYDERSSVLTGKLLAEEQEKREREGPDTSGTSQAGANHATQEDGRLLETEQTKGNGLAGYPPVQAEQESLFGLAVSGGGIRSATFNLGVLQGLADLDLLRRLDYLSGVSGGSHIAGWLAAWIRREDDGVRRVQRWLSPSRNPQPDMDKTQPIQFLRRFSNYLSPRKGFLSADSWAMYSTWLGNTFLNQVVFALFLGSLLGVPKLLLRVSRHDVWRYAHSEGWLGGLTIALFASVAALIGLNLNRFDHEARPGRGERRRPSRLWEGFGVHTTVIIGFLILALLGSYQLFWVLQDHQEPNFDWLLTYLVLFLGLLFAQICGRTWRCFYTHRAEETTIVQATMAFLFTAVSSAVCALVGLGALYLIFRWIPKPGTPSPDYAYLTAALVIGPALLLFLLGLIVTFHLGLMGRNLPDSRREWWNRLGGSMLITTALWIALSSCSLLAPWAVLWATAQPGKLSSIIQWSAVPLWLATTVIGYRWGESAQTPSFPAESPEYVRRFQLASWMPRAWIAKIAPYIYIAGLAILLSFGLYAMESWGGTFPHSQVYWNDIDVLLGHWWLPFVMFAMALVLAWRFDINEFSMHNLYRNRVVRCYLGASRADGARRPNPYTGFDPQDDLGLSGFMVQPPPPSDLAQAAPSYHGPLPIINTTLNLVAGKELAWQERKAASFAFTPLYCGYERARGQERPKRNFANYGYRPTVEYCKPRSHGPTLGTCMAISGAAINPNMGYHSSPALSFLMALFDARLGCWVGNTRHRNTWKQSSPRTGLIYLINELIGKTDDSSWFINLSDGGHFENLGLYELVRRRCKYIIASDAEEDAKFSFNGLGNAIRKCRTDFGVDIRINPDHLRPLPAPGMEQGRSRAHCAVGDIVYSPESRGKLLYIKTSLTGDEPGDVLEYKYRQSIFPHHSTFDQFFDESQFESYRALGQHIANIVLRSAVHYAPEPSFVPTTPATQRPHLLPQKSRAAPEPTFLTGNERAVRDWAARDAAENAAFLRELFRYLQAMWYPERCEMANLEVQHSNLYAELVEKLGAGRHEELAQTASTFFRTRRTGPDWRPQPDFFVYCKMIQLIHRVFQDLELEITADHPRQEGWTSIFRDWAENKEFKRAWSVVQENYDVQFRKFCQRELGLDAGTHESVRDVA